VTLFFFWLGWLLVFRLARSGLRLYGISEKWSIALMGVRRGLRAQVGASKLCLTAGPLAMTHGCKNDRADFSWRVLPGFTHLNCGWGLAQGGKHAKGIVAEKQHCCSLDTVAEM
jgi:hypothetical protein